MTVDVKTLQQEAEAARTQVTRLEVTAETAVTELAAARARLTELGFDADSDIDAEIERRAGELAEKKNAILADIATVRAEAGIA